MHGGDREDVSPYLLVRWHRKMEGRSRSCGHNVAIVIRVHDSLAMGLPLGRGCGYLAAIQLKQIPGLHLRTEAIDDEEERIDIREKPATRGASRLERAAR